MEKETLNDVFLDVRKAYRLLYNYQRRVLDLVNFISSELGFEYQGGRPHFMNTSPNSNNGNLDQSAWDWLNMYFYEFIMHPLKVGKKIVNLSIFIESDSGPFNTDKSLETLDAFSGVEDSKTRLHFLFYDNIHDNYIDDFIREGDIPAKNNRLRSEKHNGSIFLIKAFDLCDFIDQEKTISIIKELVADVNKKINVQLIKD